MASVTAREHKGIFPLCHYFAAVNNYEKMDLGTGDGKMAAG